MLVTSAPDHDTAVVRVLIVDDQAPFRSAARLVVELAGRGFEVVGEAGSGEEALEGLDEWAPDLVLMDVQMPGIDGIEATRQLRQRRPDCRVLVLSTYEAEDYETGAVAAGAVGFISKDEFEPSVLIEAMGRPA